MDSRLADFISFLSDTGISVDDRSIRFVRSELHGFGVIALRDIKPRQVLTTIPKSAILSVQTAALWQDADFKHLSSRDQWCPPLFQLSAAALFETLLEDRSPWHWYLRMLPSTLASIGVPLAESEANIRTISKGTAIDILTANMHKSLRSAFGRVRELFVNRAKKLDIAPCAAESVTYEQFALAFAWVTSRAFHVDSFHGNSLVPVADMFNHSTDAEHVHIEGSGEDESDEDSDEEGSVSGDDIESNKTAGNREGEKNGNVSARHRGQYADEDLRVVCVKGATAGEELFNTFGQKCNTVLYLNYGFTEVNNAYDTAFIQKSDVELVLKRFTKNVTDAEREMTSERQACIQTASIIILDEVQDDFFQISADSFCHGLLVLVFLHVVPWQMLAPMYEDEFQLLEYLMQLQMSDIMKAGYTQIAQIISEIAKTQLHNFPVGTCIRSDMGTLREAKDLSPLKRNTLRIRVGQRIAMEKALQKVLDCTLSETEKFGLTLSNDGTETMEPAKKRVKKT